MSEVPLFVGFIMALMGVAFLVFSIGVFLKKSRIGDAFLRKRAWKKLCKQFPSQEHIQNLEMTIQHKKWMDSIVPNLPPFEPSDKTVAEIKAEREIQWASVERALEYWKEKVLTWHQYTEKAFTVSRVSWEIIGYHQDFRMYLMAQQQQLIKWINHAPYLSEKEIEEIKTFR